MEAWRKTRLLVCLAIPKLFLFLIIPPAAPISFNYQKFLPKDETLNFTGEVYHENGVLQLTRYTKDSAGRVTYYKQLQLWDRETRQVADFTTRFSFIIDAPNKTHHGDGITFFLAHPDFPLPVPPDGTGIGLVGRRQMEDPDYPNEHPFVAVEFDTFWNPDDPPYDHVGFDIKKMWTPYTTQWYSIKDGRKYDTEITYNSSSQNLNVTFTGYKDNITAIQQDFSHIIDLRDYLPERVQFGFSSATGLYYETHTLCSWSFDSSLDLEVSNDESKKSKNESKTGLVIGLSIGSGVLIAGLCLAWLVIRKQRFRGKEDSLDNDFERGIGPRKFSYKELSTATDNFAEEQKLGEGGFGGVYKGFIKDLNTYVAVKKVSRGSRQGVKEYASEVKIISQLRHKNLVQLIGWCHQEDDLLLIYEFMPNGSLDYHLFRGRNLLTWETRYNIALGLASALLYLHEEWEQCVVHRDIKSSNIMLDSNFNAKLGDFGLARLVEHGKGSETTIVAGTRGYMAPECAFATTGKASRESDVYSFGVVALEIACGRKPIELEANEEQVIMVEWVWELYGMDNLLEAADQRLIGDFNEQEVERLMIVGLWCAHPDYIMRPTIRQAVNVLNFEAPLPNLPSKMPKPTYYAPSFSAPRTSSFLSSNAGDSGTNQTQSSGSGIYTVSSQSTAASTTVPLKNYLS